MSKTGFYVKQYRASQLVWRYPMSHQAGLPTVHEAINFGNVRGLDFTVVDGDDNLVYTSGTPLSENKTIFLQD